MLNNKQIKTQEIFQQEGLHQTRRKIIIWEDIVNQYPEKNKRLSQIYLRYLTFKKKYPAFGYKRLARLLGEPIHRTRWWYKNHNPPQPIQTTNWLKQKRLLPLYLNHQKIHLIARILGSLFGDGGIFRNLNAIFLSSSELSAVKEFGENLKTIFGEEIEENSRIIEGGEYGHSWCYQNTNRNVIRFFQALGAPIGRKSELNMEIPQWIYLNMKIADEFFSSLFGGELGTPTIHKNNNQLTSLDIGLQTDLRLKDNKIHFLKQIQQYLSLKGIETGSISISYPKKAPSRCLLRLQISKTLDNFYNFVDLIKLTYCSYKQIRLEKTLNTFIKLKYHRYTILLFRTKNKEYTMHLLNLTPYSLEIIKKSIEQEEITVKNKNPTGL